MQLLPFRIPVPVLMLVTCPQSMWLNSTSVRPVRSVLIGEASHPGPSQDEALQALRVLGLGGGLCINTAIGLPSEARGSSGTMRASPCPQGGLTMSHHQALLTIPTRSKHHYPLPLTHLLCRLQRHREPYTIFWNWWIPSPWTLPRNKLWDGSENIDGRNSSCRFYGQQQEQRMGIIRYWCGCVGCWTNLVLTC